MADSPRPPHRLARIIAALLLWLLLGVSALHERVVPPRDERQTIVAVPLTDIAREIGPLRLLEAWELRSPHIDFGGVSAMALTGPRSFLLLSDAGRAMRVTLARDGTSSAVRIDSLPGRRSVDKRGGDAESLWRDPASDHLWVGFEGRHRIARFAPGLARLEIEVRPPAMRRWPSNGGAEAMTRLADGRFLVMAERGRTRAGTIGLLFAGDPTLPATPPPVSFAYRDWGMGAVVDAATLPDGRVLLLHRSIGPWQGVLSTLAIADPAGIAPGAVWTAAPLATVAGPGLRENYEALALAPSAQGIGIWLAADDNFSGWQRTLLLHLWLPLDRLPPR